MGEFRPNEAQARAMSEDGKNILVSAGAGSGKTTVLVERVLRKLTEEKVDIDAFIIVTFTRAAAAHMKEKIYRRIKEALKNPELSADVKEHLRGQMMRVFSARICTLDSLCMDLVRENFQSVNIDPSFRIADEAEVHLLMQDVLADLLEDRYSAPTDAFLDFVQYYTDKNDAKLDEIILTMYRFSQSHPEPERWIRRAANAYLHAAQLGQVADEEENAWLFALAQMVQSEETSLLDMAARALTLCEANGGPFMYTPVIEKLAVRIKELEGESFDNKRFLLAAVLEDWESLPRVNKKDEVNPGLKDRAKNMYGEIKKRLQDLQVTFFNQTLEEQYLDMAKCAAVAKTIADLTLAFSARLWTEKRARQIADFGDVAHLALQVLVQRDENGELFYTEVADSIAQATHEIILDEYQDTSRMQDALVEALSAARFGRPNVFMVGDVKQSIYGFRMACPDLFIGKYNAYARDGEIAARIILGENYRSRKEVVDFINLVFDKIMIPQVGGIDYKDGNRMEAGAQFADVPGESLVPEVLFIDGAGSLRKHAESYEIARKIEELVATGHVQDGDGLRKIKYSDIAILTRKTNNPEIEKMLTDRKIPMQKASSRGFFAAFEVRLTLDYLKVIDNPYQDIPLAAVLLSPLVGLTANELAIIKTKNTDKPFRLYKACTSYTECFADETAEKLKTFFALLSAFRALEKSVGFHAFLNEVMERSGLYHCCMAMTYGDGRKANLDYIKVLAEKYMQGSYTGLFHFLRYVDAIQKANIDFGSFMGSAGEDLSDAVTMMTIHKSKGLEFPVVIIADAGRLISDQDKGSPIFLDDRLGLGIEYRDTQTRIKKKTLLMKTIAEKKQAEMIAEEIRLLYVAMSRAKERLYIFGSSHQMKTRRKEWESKGPGFAPDAGAIQKDNSYLFLLADAMASATEEEKAMFACTIKELADVTFGRLDEVYQEQARRSLLERLFGRKKKKKRKKTEEAQEQAEEVLTENPDLEEDAEALTDDADAQEAPELTKEELAKEAGIYVYDYPYLSATKTHIKITASQLEKKETDRGEKEEEAYLFDAGKAQAKKQQAEQKETPAQDKNLLFGAERGNAYHAFFERLDYAAITGDLAASVQEQVAKLKVQGHLSDAEAATIETDKMVRFLQSDIGRRMKNAALNGKLKREQQFVMAAEIDGNPDGILQGIIDAFFIEGDHVILVDYKTDRNTNERHFIEIYQPQQEEYAKALESALRLPVTEKILYSLELGREIYLE